MLCGREEKGEEREDGGGWEELELEAKRRERREGGRREDRAGWVGGTEEDSPQQVLMGSWDREGAADKDAPCSMLRPQ